MKKIYLILLSAFATGIVNAQPQIRNYSFENWTGSVPDSWTIFDQTNVMNAGALQRKTGGTNGSYSLKLGVYTNTFLWGAEVDLGDTISTMPGGIAFDYYEQDESFGLNDVYIKVYFYDTAGNMVKQFSNGFRNNSTTFNTAKLYFSFPTGTKLKRYLINMYYYAMNGSNTNDYCVIDNVRFLPLGAGVSEVNESEKISIYPNPSKNFISVDLKRNANYEITGIDGRILKQGMLESSGNRIDISEFQCGIYFLLVDDGSKKLNTKFMKD